jgi:hypothetical protein
MLRRDWSPFCVGNIASRGGWRAQKAKTKYDSGEASLFHQNHQAQDDVSD